MAQSIQNFINIIIYLFVSGNKAHKHHKHEQKKTDRHRDIISSMQFIVIIKAIQKAKNARSYWKNLRSDAPLVTKMSRWKKVQRMQKVDSRWNRKK